jgi:hypothetical protein
VLLRCPSRQQACDEVILGNIPISREDDVAMLVALAMAIDLSPEFPASVDELIAVDIRVSALSSLGCAV